MPVDQDWKDKVTDWLIEREIDRMLDVGDGVDHFQEQWKNRLDPAEAVERIVNFLYKVAQLGPPAE